MAVSYIKSLGYGATATPEWEHNEAFAHTDTDETLKISDIKDSAGYYTGYELYSKVAFTRRGNALTSESSTDWPLEVIEQLAATTADTFAEYHIRNIPAGTYYKIGLSGFTNNIERTTLFTVDDQSAEYDPANINPVDPPVYFEGFVNSTGVVKIRVEKGVNGSYYGHLNGLSLETNEALISPFKPSEANTYISSLFRGSLETKWRSGISTFDFTKSVEIFDSPDYIVVVLSGDVSPSVINFNSLPMTQQLQFNDSNSYRGSFYTIKAPANGVYDFYVSNGNSISQSCAILTVYNSAGVGEVDSLQFWSTSKTISLNTNMGDLAIDLSGESAPSGTDVSGANQTKVFKNNKGYLTAKNSVGVSTDMSRSGLSGFSGLGAIVLLYESGTPLGSEQAIEIANQELHSNSDLLSIVVENAISTDFTESSSLASLVKVSCIEVANLKNSKSRSNTSTITVGASGVVEISVSHAESTSESTEASVKVDLHLTSESSESNCNSYDVSISKESEVVCSPNISEVDTTYLKIVNTSNISIDSISHSTTNSLGLTPSVNQNTAVMVSQSVVTTTTSFVGRDSESTPTFINLSVVLKENIFSNNIKNPEREVVLLHK